MKEMPTVLVMENCSLTTIVRKGELKQEHKRLEEEFYACCGVMRQVWANEYRDKHPVFDPTSAGFRSFVASKKRQIAKCVRGDNLYGDVTENGNFVTHMCGKPESILYLMGV